MKRQFITYHDRWRRGPMTFWVHIEADGQPWSSARRFDPPAPDPVPGKGFPFFQVEVDGFTFEFASLDELDVCIATLSRKMLPSSAPDDRARRAGPSQHWLNRLPGWTKPWRYREKAVKAMKEARIAFAEEIGSE